MTILKVVPDFVYRVVNVTVAMDDGRNVLFAVTSHLDLDDQITKYAQFCSEVDHLTALVGNVGDKEAVLAKSQLV